MCGTFLLMSLHQNTKWELCWLPRPRNSPMRQECQLPFAHLQSCLLLGCDMLLLGVIPEVLIKRGSRECDAKTGILVICCLSTSYFWIPFFIIHSLQRLKKKKAFQNKSFFFFLLRLFILIYMKKAHYLLELQITSIFGYSLGWSTVPYFQTALRYSSLSQVTFMMKREALWSRRYSTRKARGRRPWCVWRRERLNRTGGQGWKGVKWVGRKWHGRERQVPGYQRLVK